MLIEGKINLLCICRDLCTKLLNFGEKCVAIIEFTSHSEKKLLWRQSEIIVFVYTEIVAFQVKIHKSL